MESLASMVKFTTPKGMKLPVTPGPDAFVNCSLVEPGKLLIYKNKPNDKAQMGGGQHIPILNVGENGLATIS